MGNTLNWREVTGLENPGGLLLPEAWPASQMQPTPARRIFRCLCSKFFCSGWRTFGRGERLSDASDIVSALKDRNDPPAPART